MVVFWDTSAIVPLIFAEPNTPAAQEIAGGATQSYAWSWLRVEAEAALLRRGARSGDWQDLGSVLSVMHWVDMEVDFESVCAFNRKLALRAADAGHLYCFQQASIVLPEMVLACFDEEMVAAAKRKRFRLWR